MPAARVKPRPRRKKKQPRIYTGAVAQLVSRLRRVQQRQLGPNVGNANNLSLPYVAA